MADLSNPQTDGGHYTIAVAAGTTGADSVVSAYPGRVCKITITAAGTAALKLYDHASASSGATQIWTSPGTTVLGEVYTINIPVANGIVFLKANGTPSCTVSYTKDGQVPPTHKARQVSTDGNYASHHAAGAGGASAALAAPGQLCSVHVLAQGSATTTIYDSASAASGTALFVVPASGTTAVAAGTRYNLQVPAANGIYVGGASNTSQIVVTYNKGGALGA